MRSELRARPPPEAARAGFRLRLVAQLSARGHCFDAKTLLEMTQRFERHLDQPNNMTVTRLDPPRTHDQQPLSLRPPLRPPARPVQGSQNGRPRHRPAQKVRRYGLRTAGTPKVPAAATRRAPRGEAPSHTHILSLHSGAHTPAQPAQPGRPRPRAVRLPPLHSLPTAGTRLLTQSQGRHHRCPSAARRQHKRHSC